MISINELFKLLPITLFFILVFNTMQTVVSAQVIDINL
jgi:hypothetical protein